jgi:hypothetical protein
MLLEWVAMPTAQKIGGWEAERTSDLRTNPARFAFVQAGLFRIYVIADKTAQSKLEEADRQARG